MFWTPGRRRTQLCWGSLSWDKVGKWFNCQSKHKLVSWKSASMGFGALAGLCGLDFAFDIGSLAFVLWVASLPWEGRYRQTAARPRWKEMSFRQQIPWPAVRHWDAEASAGTSRRFPFWAGYRGGGLSIYPMLSVYPNVSGKLKWIGLSLDVCQPCWLR